MPSAETSDKKILIITYYWPPAGGPGVQRWLKFTRYLPEFGYSPIVLTVDEKFASYAITDTSLLNEIDPKLTVHRTKTRELFNVYLKLTNKKTIPFSGFVHEGKTGLREKLIRFFRTHLFIPDPRKSWNRYALKAATGLIKKENIRYIITTSPPHSTQLIGLKLKKRFPTLTWLADFRDPWTHIFYFDQLNHSFISRRLHKKLEEKVITGADKVITVSNSMKKEFLNDYGLKIVPDKIQVITNGYDEEDFKGLKPEPDKEFTITYTGTLADNYRIDSLIEAVANINRGNSQKIKLRFVGAVCRKYMDILTDRIGTEQIEIIQPVPHRQAIGFILRSHMLLLIIPDAPHNRAIVTGKIFEYLAAKKPILGIGPVDGDAAGILQQTGAGRIFGYEDKSSIYNYLIKLLKEPDSENTQFAFKNVESYDRRNLTAKLNELL